MTMKYGIQLYTVRDDMERDFEGTLTRIAEIGYKAVEFHSFYNKSAAEVKQITDRIGIKVISGFYIIIMNMSLQRIAGNTVWIL